MRNLEFAMRLVSEGVADMEDRGFKVVPSVAREATAYAFGAIEAVGSPDKIINSTSKVNQITKRIEEILSKGRVKKNPVRRSDESPLYVKYLSLKSGEEPFMMQGSKYEYVWAEYPGGIKDIGVYSYANDLVYSYDSFRQMMNLDRTNPLRPRKGEKTKAFVSRCMSEEKMSFPEPKQRIAVCLSKSRRRRNPLESGATISDDKDINTKASNMG